GKERAAISSIVETLCRKSGKGLAQAISPARLTRFLTGDSMPGRSPHPVAQIAACRRDMSDLAANWRAIAGRSAARARAEAEVQVFNQTIVALQGRFADSPRLQAPPLHEVRLLALGVSS